MKKRSQLYDYLEKSGVLENGSKEQINQIKKKYWALVRKEYRKQQRKNCKTYTVFLTKSEQEEIDKIVQKKKTNTTAFIKASALQITRGSSGVDKKLVGQIRQIFFEAYAEVQDNVSESALKHFSELEKKILNLLQH